MPFIELLLIIIYFSINFSIVSCDTILNACDHEKYLESCPYSEYSVCNMSTGYCQCKPEYPISLSSLTPCLDYKDLDQDCMHSSQCSESNDRYVCYDEEYKELNDTVVLENWFKNDQKYNNHQNKV
jgi:hypothetical protein